MLAVSDYTPSLIGQKQGVKRNPFQNLFDIFPQSSTANADMKCSCPCLSPVGVRPFVPQMVRLPVFSGDSPFLYSTILSGF